MIDLTARQRQVLEVIIWHIDTYGYPPTYREILDRIGVGGNSNQTNAAHDHLKALERKGFVRLDAQTPRGIQVLRFPEGVQAKVAVMPASVVREWREGESG